MHIAEDLLDEGGTGVGSLFAAAGARSRLRLKCLRSALKAFLEHPAFQTSREFVVVTDGSRREGSAVKLRSFKVSLPPESVRPFKARNRFRPLTFLVFARADYEAWPDGGEEARGLCGWSAGGPSAALDTTSF